MGYGEYNGYDTSRRTPVVNKEGCIKCDKCLEFCLGDVLKMRMAVHAAHIAILTRSTSFEEFF